MSHLKPKIGMWYQDKEQGTVFEIVAQDDEFIEVQHEDGDIEEFDLDAWKELSLRQIDAPEDWRNGLGLCEEDMKMDDDVLHPENWSGSLVDLEPEVEIDIDDA